MGPLLAVGLLAASRLPSSSSRSYNLLSVPNGRGLPSPVLNLVVDFFKFYPFLGSINIRSMQNHLVPQSFHI